tara:strand:- start:2657 stop:3241 length:585 start_codon:yes stop_codon:yes gene_type:complete
MDTIFILENENLGTWYVGKINIKMNVNGFPIYRTLTQDQLNDNLYKKYTQYENPYLNLIFLNKSCHICHGIERWMTILDYKINREPERYEEIKRLLTAGWTVNDTLEYSSIYIFNTKSSVTNKLYADLKKNWNKYSPCTLKKSLNFINKTDKEKYDIRKRNPKFLFEQSRKQLLYRMGKGYTPKKSTLIKYNLS